MIATTEKTVDLVRQPFVNLEAERCVLGSCLIGCEALEGVLGSGLSADDFFRTPYRKIYRAMVAMREAAYLVNARNLAAYLACDGTFEQIGGDEFLAELVESVPHAENACYYAGIVRERAIQRRVVDGCTELLRLCYQNTHTTDEILDRLSLFTALVTGQAVPYESYISSDEWKARADAAKERAAWRCQVCNVHRDHAILDAHHRTYERLGREDPGDLFVLCRECHGIFHAAGKLAKPPRDQRVLSCY